MKKIILLILFLIFILTGSIFLFNSDEFVNKTMNIKDGFCNITCVKYKYNSEYKDNELKINISFSNISGKMLELSKSLILQDDWLIKLKLLDKNEKLIDDIYILQNDLKDCKNGSCTVQTVIKADKKQVRKIKYLSAEYKVPLCNKESAGLSDKKTVVVYYSNSGNTKNVAEYISKILKCDLFEIKSEEVYKNSNILELKNLVQNQINSNYIPKINNTDISKYDVIFIGSPVWRSHISLPVKSFLLANNFKNKTIIPFYTFGGKGDKNILDNEIKNYTRTDVKPSFLTVWNGVAFLEYRLLQWLNETYL